MLQRRKQEALARAKGTSRRASGWAGEKAARSGDSSGSSRATYTSKLGRIIFGHSLRPCQGQGASQGEESVLTESGRAGEITARDGRVRSLDFLNSLRECAPGVANSFSEAY